MKFWYLQFHRYPFEQIVTGCDHHTAIDIKDATGATTIWPIKPMMAAKMACGDTTDEEYREWIEEQERIGYCPACVEDYAAELFDIYRSLMIEALEVEGEEELIHKVDEMAEKDQTALAGIQNVVESQAWFELTNRTEIDKLSPEMKDEIWRRFQEMRKQSGY